MYGGGYSDETSIGVYWIASEEDRASFKGYLKQGRMKLGAWLKTRIFGKKVIGSAGTCHREKDK